MWTVLCLQTLHIDQGLITGSARVGANVPFSKHTVLVDVISATDKLEKLFDFPTQLVQLSSSLILGRTCVPYQLRLILKLLLKKCLKLLQLSLVRFLSE